MMGSQKVPPEMAMNVTLNITILPAQEAFLVDATPPTPSPRRWIQVKARSLTLSKTPLNGRFGFQ
jgi:hypothetical protein